MQDAASIVDDDIDRKALRALRERFLALNAARLQGLRERLSHDQRVFVDALPVLLHSNHAALPGFVDFDAAAGIDRYVPDRHAIAAVRTFALSYTHERFVERRNDLLAVYLTAPSRAGDAVALTLSVCCSGALHDGLGRKLAGIAAFAAERAIVLTPLLIDPDAQAFHAQRRTPCLARDAFYRTAILLAGRYPIWWLVPPELEDRHADYCARLKAQRFIGRTETIDLGPAQRIPHDECIAAGVDVLEHALDAPYTNLHASMLLEAYATTASEPLARRYKRHVWGGAAPLDDGGLAHERLAEHLMRIGAAERLELARHCLLACTDPSQQRERAAQWGWDETQVRRARADHELTIAEVDTANRRVQAELVHQYVFLVAQRDALDEATRARLDVIGVRIDRLVQRPFGALTRVNAALLPKRVAGTVRLEFDGGQWRALDDRRIAFTAPRIAAVMTWAHLNRMTLDNLRGLDVNRRNACGRMLDLLTRHAKVTSAFRVWIVNAQETAMALQASHGDAIISDWDDALDFSGFHANLIAGIDVVDVGPDGAAIRHHVGDDGLVDALVAVAAEPTVALYIGCVAGRHERLIEERLVALIGEVRAAFADPARLVRFVVALGDGYAIVERGSRGVRARTAANDPDLYEALAAPPRRHALVVDSRNPRLTGLRLLCSLRAADPTERDRIFVHDQRGLVRVWVDARDGIIHRLTPPELPAHDVAAGIWALLATRRDRSARLFLAHGDVAPTPFVAGNGDGRRGAIVAPELARRGLVDALREMFAIERRTVG